MASGGCFLIPVVSKRNKGVTLANHSKRGRVGAGWCLASKRRRRSEVSGRNGALPADGGSDLHSVPGGRKVVAGLAGPKRPSGPNSTYKF
jgi:hypothetical protein